MSALKMSMTVTGGRELARKLGQLEDAVAGKHLVTALQAGALPIQNRWAETAPYRTGQYRRSIHTEVIESAPTHAAVAIGTNISKPPYPLFLEYGTRKMAARPSARPAFDSQKDAAMAETTRVLRHLILQAAR